VKRLSGEGGEGVSSACVVSSQLSSGTRVSACVVEQLRVAARVGASDVAVVTASAEEP
jgi:hypothetical protein